MKENESKKGCHLCKSMSSKKAVAYSKEVTFEMLPSGR